MGQVAYLLPKKDLGVEIEWTMDGDEFRFTTPVAPSNPIPAPEDDTVVEYLQT